MKKTILGLTMMLFLTASAAFAAPGTATGNMSVSATVAADCVVNSVGAMSFGSNLGINFTINNVNATASSVINYTCTNSGVAPSIRLGQGSNADTGSTDGTPLRRMKHATLNSYISYALYKDNTGTANPWNNTLATSVAGTADGSAHNVTAYGIATAANVPAGPYADTVTVSVDF